MSAACLPKRVRLLVLAFAALSLAGWFRLWQALAFRADLAAVDLRPGPAWLAISGALVGVLGAVTAWQLARRLPHAATLARLVAPAAALGYWGERLLFTRTDSGYANLPFSIAVTLISLGATYWVLAWWQRRGFQPDRRTE